MAGKVPSPEITDISDDISDLNAEDRVYRSASGYVVKVKTRRLAVDDAHVLIYAMTPSLCGDAGKAVAHPTQPDKPWIGERHLVQVQSDGPSDDVAVLIEDGRRLLVARTELAALNHAQAQRPIPGVATIH